MESPDLRYMPSCGLGMRVYGMKDYGWEPHTRGQREQTQEEKHAFASVDKRKVRFDYPDPHL